MIVVDASMVVDDLIAGRALDGPLVAPDHLFVECASAFARLARAGALDPSDADAAVRLLGDLPITLIPTRTLLATAWALRASVAISDAFYVACALVTGGTLLTHDRRLARAATAVGVDVQS